jgi:hypothetical protein
MTNAAGSGNTCLHGDTYGLTAVSPIRPDEGRRSPRLELERLLAEMPTLAESPLAKLTDTHFARWVVINRLPFEGKRAWADTLPVPYLMFTSQFDSTLDDYLERMCTLIPSTVEAVWGKCQGFPGTEPRAFAGYIKQCQVETTFFFGAYPSADVSVVKRALEVQDATRRFVMASQGRSTSELRASFNQFRDRLFPARRG